MKSFYFRNGIVPPSDRYKLIASAGLGNYSGELKLYQNIRLRTYYLALEDDSDPSVTLKEISEIFAKNFINELSKVD